MNHSYHESIMLFWIVTTLLFHIIPLDAFQPTVILSSSSLSSTRQWKNGKSLYMSTEPIVASQPTELPDSLIDAAERAAISCSSFVETSGPVSRCRVDFDTTAGDETYTILKTSTEFMQNLVRFLSYKIVPGLQDRKQDEMRRLIEARVGLKQIVDQEQIRGSDNNDDDDDKEGNVIDVDLKQRYIRILETNGKDPDDDDDGRWTGPTVRVYFPDEGNAALARRDWMTASVDLPPCVEFSSCGGVQVQDISRDVLVFFFCPRASESEQVEALLQKTEAEATNLQLTVFVNPQLVDMGVTGFGLAGRMLRERLLDGLTGTYYLRTLAWGALTRSWPHAYSIWQEDEGAEGGYKLLRTLTRLPSNPEVEDIYDMENGGGGGGPAKAGGGPLDQLGDFVNGMMRL